MRSHRLGRSSSKWSCKKEHFTAEDAEEAQRTRGMILNVIPAKAGIHFSAARAVERWVPAFAGTTAFLIRVLCTFLASFALPILVAVALFALTKPAYAACSGPVADNGARLRLASAAPEGGVGLTFLGHASFLIESSQGVTIVTDYNDMIRAPVVPDIVTMNNAHPTHYTDAVEPGVKFVLRGWDAAGGIATHHLDYRDVKIHNVPTNVREFGSTRYNGNSIFVFDVGDLCLAHLGHLHHTLTPGHLADLGPIDVVMVPVDGGYTLNQDDMIAVLQQIKPKIAVPMHVFTPATLEKFLARAAAFYTVKRAEDPSIVLTRATLPAEPEMLVLPGR
jgi:L-ascorbate metabolism protein UlaG (beta-lactamase superfamily)